MLIANPHKNVIYFVKYLISPFKFIYKDLIDFLNKTKLPIHVLSYTTLIAKTNRFNTNIDVLDANRTISSVPISGIGHDVIS
jgi:hypothetical protein